MKKNKKKVIGDLTIRYYPMNENKYNQVSVIVFWDNKSIWDGRIIRNQADIDVVIKNMAIDRGLYLWGISKNGKNDTLIKYIYNSIRNDEAPTVKEYMMEVLK